MDHKNNRNTQRNLYQPGQDKKNKTQVILGGDLTSKLQVNKDGKSQIQYRNKKNTTGANR